MTDDEFATYEANWPSKRGWTLEQRTKWYRGRYNQICALYQRGDSVRELSQNFALCPERIRQILKKYQVYLPWRNA